MALAGKCIVKHPVPGPGPARAPEPVSAGLTGNPLHTAPCRVSAVAQAGGRQARKGAEMPGASLSVSEPVLPKGGSWALGGQKYS